MPTANCPLPTLFNLSPQHSELSTFFQLEAEPDLQNQSYSHTVPSPNGPIGPIGPISPMFFIFTQHSELST